MTTVMSDECWTLTRGQTKNVENEIQRNAASKVLIETKFEKEIIKVNSESKYKVNSAKKETNTKPGTRKI